MKSNRNYLMVGCAIALSLSCFPTMSSADGVSTVPGDDPGQTEAVKVQVSGTITDANGDPLVGATVFDASSASGTVSDVDGKFTISCAGNSQLIVKYIGYDDVTMPLEGRTDVDIKMKESSDELSEVVVVGYGVQKKVNLSGAVSQIDTKDIERRPIADISKGLQGMVPNLNIDFMSGEPGKAAQINIRGEASLNGGSPLILIDGIESNVDEMNRLLPADIASISVLKDAASAAIYGARAAFGVILITTKQGEGDRITISYNNTFSWKRPSQLTNKTTDPFIYLKLKNVAVLNTPWSSGHVADDEHLIWARQRSDDPDGTEPVRLNPLDATQWEYMGNTDWTKEYLYRYTPSTTHNVSVSGATAKTRFYLSAGYGNEDGVLSKLAQSDFYQRYNTRLKVSYQVWDWLNVGNNTTFVMTKRHKPSYYNLDAIYDAEPWNIDRNPDGTWTNSELGRTLAQIADGGGTKEESSKIQSTFTGEVRLWNDMVRINSDFTFAKGYEDTEEYNNRYQIGYGPEDLREEGDSKALRGNASSLYTVFNLYGTFSKTFGKHALTAVVGYNQEYYRWDRFTAERMNTLSPALHNLGLASGDQYTTEEYKDWAIRGLYYRASYVYDDKYIIEADGRYDGTSRFPKNKRFGFFPSASAAWRIEQEPFFKPLRSIFSNLKIRASYGSLGNQLVSEYGFMPTLTAQTGTYIIDGKLQQTVSAPGLVSPNYTWEEVTTVNGGVDVGLLDNRLNLSFDIYRRDTKGMLTQGKELPGVLGATEPKENAANLKTTGWELSVSYQDRFTVGGKPLALGAKFMLSDNQTVITRFDNPSRNLSQYYEGQKLGEIWGLQNDGLFRSQDDIAALDESQIIPWGALTITEGWPRYKDLDGDHKITKGSTVDKPGDLAVIGNNHPRFRYGLNLSADWNGIDASVFIQGIGKRDYYPVSFLYWSFFQQPYSGGQLHAFDFYRDRAESPEEMAGDSRSWIAAGLANQNLNSQYPILQCWLADKNLGTGINAMGLAIPQTKYMLNGAYMRLKNITVGYTLPIRWVSRIGLSKVRIYVSGDNLFEISKLKKYFDPEAVTNQDSFGYVYPFNRQYTVGMNITF